MATYNAFITSKAIRSFSDLPPKLVAAHRAFDPSTPLSDIKVITIYLHNTTGNWLYVGGSGSDGMDYRCVPQHWIAPRITQQALWSYIDKALRADNRTGTFGSSSTSPP